MPNTAFAASLFDALDRATREGRGIVRASYGPGEQAAHDIMHAAALELGLACRVDPIGNLMMTLPGRDRSAPGIIIGSHLDSVPQGGNFDGAAGVAAGLAALARLRNMGFVPSCDITVMAIRAEESVWFDIPYLGSAGAFGLLDPAVLEVRRSDNGVMLADSLRAAGFDRDTLAMQRSLLEPASIAAYLEVHIEQGPVLVEEALPIAVVSGIRGCLRFRAARCHGVYAHSGAVPRRYRSDAVAATVALLHHMQLHWDKAEARGDDLVMTSGEFFTDPAMHGASRVAGDVQFVLDIRSTSDTVMQDVAAEFRRAAAHIATEYRVTFDLGVGSYSPPAMMDAGLRQRLLSLSGQPFEMASGAGHDAAIFAKVGIRSAMIFIRNRNGSHNPDEAMAMADFAVAEDLLVRLLLDFPS
ncbi:hydantoinase/carbamoylase family amidase [Acidisoma silvae]|uniref:Hydantoinase/carbamoylase family amidase n=1 Tax=Acidisoma silvae TaxID=2802396 RepID=A0A963YXP4_9PROT|nr:hydantoinase/carbamoylase family amidase [Acidisoma silvae]MCB8878210.1 hydantoinase/carbamoylase family amidase [Acidisoma silvae]